MTSDMRSGFPSVRFKELIKGKPRHGIYKPPEFFGRGTKIIKMGMQSANPFINEGNILDLIEASAEEIERFRIFENDLLFLRTSLVMEGTGKCSIVRKLTAPALFVSNLIAVSLDKTKANPLFYYYYFSSDGGRQNVLSLCEQTAASTIRSSDLQELIVPFPELEDQNRIANMLYAIDQKIELNSRLNFTLQRMGEALFKRWFLDFEFPNEEDKPYKSSGGEMVYDEVLDKEIPTEWHVKPIDEIADFLNGLALQKFPARDGEEYLPVVKIRELRQGITESSDKASLDVPKTYIVDDGDILFSWSGSLEVVIWGFGKGALNQHLFKVTSSEYPKWFFYYWIVHYLPEYRQIAADKATTMGHIQRHHLTGSQVTIPDDKTLERMDRLLAPILERMSMIKVETRILSEIRDSLLPKLMSGKIRVPVPNENVGHGDV